MQRPLPWNISTINQLKIFKTLGFLLLLVFVWAGCEKDEEDLSYLDYKKALSTPPIFAIYKTKQDYFHNVNLGTSPSGEIKFSQQFIDNDSRVTVYKGKFYYNSRYRLDDNYILSYEISPSDCFTSISYDEYIRDKMSPIYNEGLINPKLVQNIIDRDPFTEFYYTSSEYSGFTIEEINQLIKEKNLEEFFTKIK
jgi:hypothetical protein